MAPRVLAMASRQERNIPIVTGNISELCDVAFACEGVKGNPLANNLCNKCSELRIPGCRSCFAWIQSGFHSLAASFHMRVRSAAFVITRILVCVLQGIPAGLAARKNAFYGITVECYVLPICCRKERIYETLCNSTN